ncbi:hypothetical protein L9F63_004931 [Diploptera punctata]|uniref:Uncharacterized protein n=1 Tax=Diploptera punctata TaxID=6984 RepID=A0AAD7ZEI8_DIPPU|nr:hypothetical protein L9F63_004931 [Diploptera punctata]
MFGDENRKTISGQQTSRQSCTPHTLKGHGAENLRYPNKAALLDIGNVLKENKPLRDRIKSSNNQESQLSTRTPLQKTKLSAQTPNLKPTIRSPLSDLLPSKQRSRVPVFQQPNQTLQAKTSKLVKIDSCITEVDDDFPSWNPDNYLPEVDDYTDILPMDVRRSDEEIYKLVNFWEMSKISEPLDLESDEEVAVEDNSDFIYRPEANFIVMEEPFPVPLSSDNGKVI